LIKLEDLKKYKDLKIQVYSPTQAGAISRIQRLKQIKTIKYLKIQGSKEYKNTSIRLKI